MILGTTDIKENGIFTIMGIQTKESRRINVFQPQTINDLGLKHNCRNNLPVALPDPHRVVQSSSYCA